MQLTLPDAHSAKQNLIMHSLTLPGVKEVWVASGSKFGKTLSATNAVCLGATIKHQGVFRWVAPIYSQAMIGKRYVERILPKELYVKNSSVTTPSIRINHTDSVSEFWHGTNPETLEGEGTHGNFLDEAAKMKLQVYDSVRTTTTFTRGKIIGVSTPRGKNWFFEKCMRAKEQMEWALKNNKTPEQLFITAPTSANPYVDKDWIADAKKQMPDRLFRQYLLAEFVDDGSVFVGFRDCLEGAKLELEPNNEYWVHPEAKTMTVTIGVDWAKIEDYLVFTAWTCTPKPHLVGLFRTQGMRYIDAVNRLQSFCRQFREVVTVKHDMTGVGVAIDEYLAYTDLPFEGVTFTNTNKNDMVNALMLAFQVGNVTLPYWEAMLAELDAYEVTTTSLGRFSYAAPSGLHDDIVSSMMLGFLAAQEASGGAEIRNEVQKVSKPEWLLDIESDV